MNAFTDEDLKRLSEILDDKCHCKGEAHESDCAWLLFRRMNARLEAVELYVDRHPCDVPGHGVGCAVKDEWRKACGK